MGADRRPVCHRCAQIKQACDGSLPCSRCTRLSLPCRPRDAAVRSANGLPIDDRNGLYPNDDVQLPKARIRRVQTGCLMCKKRKKKCDEVKPSCGDCRRLCLDCVWPVERQKGAMNKAMGVSRAPIATHTATNALSLSPTHENMLQISPTATDVIIKDEYSQYSPSSSSGSGSVNGSVNGQAEPNGGLILVNNSVETDLSPIEAMIWAGVSQELPWFDSSSVLSSNGSPPDSVNSMTLSTYIPRIIPQLTSPVDRALFNHYTSVVSGILSRRPSTSNPYNHYLLPMAYSNDLVLHCILALSGNHWRKLQPNLANRGLYHQSKAQQALAQLLPHVNKTSADIALVGSLLLCMTELFDGTSQGWEVHLNGAKRLLSALRRQQHGEGWTGHYKFLLRLSRFLDSAATTSTCRPPLMGSEADEARALEGLAASPEEDDSAVYGIPKELFHLVDQVNTLADKRKFRVDAASEARFREEAALVEDMLNTWSHERNRALAMNSRFAPSSPGPSHSGSDLGSSEDVHNATTAYEYALRLRLYQIIEGYNIHDPPVQPAVTAILDSVQRIRYGSPLEACLLFPLVMAGGACQALEQRVIVQDKLMVMERTCGFGYVYNARQLVEKVWRRRDDAGGEGTEEGSVVNWAKIRYEEMHGLVVF